MHADQAHGQAHDIVQVSVAFVFSVGCGRQANRGHCCEGVAGQLGRASISQLHACVQSRQGYSVVVAVGVPLLCAWTIPGCLGVKEQGSIALIPVSGC